MGPLGALVPTEDLSCEEALQEKPEDKGDAVWLAVEAGSLLFIGPDLRDLAERSLIYEGIDPERTLWICCVGPDAENSVDDGIVWRKRGDPRKVRAVGTCQ